ncbi:unnamed protein product [Symbiodinium sp. CCMP2592]|nr:unnamed protein product [Symbiodinium sp. CCMP2592]
MNNSARPTKHGIDPSLVADTIVEQNSDAVTLRIKSKVLSSLRDDGPNNQSTKELQRCGGSHLEPRYCVLAGGVDKNIGWLWATLYIVTGHWLILTERSSGALNSDGMKQSVFDQHANLALVAALVLTVLLPLAYEYSGDYLQNDSETLSVFNGAFASWVGEDWLSDHIGFLEDIGHICYGLAAFNTWAAVCACCFILLGCIELKTDTEVLAFVTRMGRLYLLPYFLWISSAIAIPAMALRAFLVLRDWICVAISLGLTVIIILVLACFLISAIKAVVNTKLGGQRYCALSLTAEECKEDVKAYLKEVGVDASLKECLLHLQCQGEGGLIVPLANLTAMTVKLEYARQMVEKLGIREAEKESFLPIILTS